MYHEPDGPLSGYSSSGAPAYEKRRPETLEEAEREIRRCVATCLAALRAIRYGVPIPDSARFEGLASPARFAILDDRGPTEPTRRPRPQPRLIDRNHPLWDRDLDG
jgi:hypothetical protein